MPEPQGALSPVAPVRAISVMQPWANLLLLGVKRTENRGRAHPWSGAVGDRLWLHASQKADPDVPAELLTAAFSRSRDVRGAVLGSFTLAGVHHGGSGRCRCDKDWAWPDTWHLVCVDMEALPEPIPVRGALGLWTFSHDASATQDAP